MKGARFKWTHDQTKGAWWVTRKAWLGWDHIDSFNEKDPVKGRQRCEAIIEHYAKSRVVSIYYDRDGRQIAGFDIE